METRNIIWRACTEHATQAIERTPSSKIEFDIADTHGQARGALPFELLEGQKDIGMVINDALLIGTAVAGFSGLFCSRKKRGYLYVASAVLPVIANVLVWRKILMAGDVLFAFVIVGIAVLVGYSSQFHTADADTYYHLAGYRKIADNPLSFGLL